MSDLNLTLKTYKAKNPVILALKIAQVIELENGACLVPEDGQLALIVSQEFLKEFHPEPTNWVVAYSDGHLGLMSAEMFEDEHAGFSAVSA